MVTDHCWLMLCTVQALFRLCLHNSCREQFPPILRGHLGLDYTLPTRMSSSWRKVLLRASSWMGCIAWRLLSTAGACNYHKSSDCSLQLWTEEHGWCKYQVRTSESGLFLMASDESLAVSGQMGENRWWVDLGSHLLGIAWIWKWGGMLSHAFSTIIGFPTVVLMALLMAV